MGARVAPAPPGSRRRTLETFGLILGGIGVMTFVGSFFLMSALADAYSGASVCGAAAAARGDSSDCLLRTSAVLVSKHASRRGGGLGLKLRMAGTQKIRTLVVYTRHGAKRFRAGETYQLQVFRDRLTGIRDRAGVFVAAANNPKSSPLTLRYASIAAMALGLLALVSRLLRKPKADSSRSG
jgi:hypothetical protein